MADLKDILDEDDEMKYVHGVLRSDINSIVSAIEAELPSEATLRFLTAMETLMGCAGCSEQEWTDKYGDVFRDAMKTWRDLRYDAAPIGGTGGFQVSKEKPNE